MTQDTERWTIWACQGCGRIGYSAGDLLSQGCEGKPEEYVPASSLQEVERERDELREALAEDRDKWNFDTLLMVGDLLLERVYPEGVPLISEGDDPGPRLVRAVRDCRAALSEQEGGGEGEQQGARDGVDRAREGE